MTQAKAEQIISSVVAAGFSATVDQLLDGSWTVLVRAPGYTIDAATVYNFVNSNGVLGNSNMVLLS